MALNCVTPADQDWLSEMFDETLEKSTLARAYEALAFASKLVERKRKVASVYQEFESEMTELRKVVQYNDEWFSCLNTDLTTLRAEKDSAAKVLEATQESLEKLEEQVRSSVTSYRKVKKKLEEKKQLLRELQVEMDSLRVRINDAGTKALNKYLKSEACKVHYMATASLAVLKTAHSIWVQVKERQPDFNFEGISEVENMLMWLESGAYKPGSSVGKLDIPRPSSFVIPQVPLDEVGGQSSSFSPGGATASGTKQIVNSAPLETAPEQNVAQSVEHGEENLPPVLSTMPAALVTPEDAVDTPMI
ncbi:M protein, serotype 5-like [Telopea speciosissima]|uniref:M protein, serotype 5-like n=1 Tax=Telopea speciosissima TaxID=54955 RepID=UPI001CC42F9A|nr:M protein, serotype 5-like [Telopea speciosissima]